MSEYGAPIRRQKSRTQRGIDRDVTARLIELERELPKPSKEMTRIVVARRATRLLRRLAVYFVLVVLAVSVVGGALEWRRPLPELQLKVASIRVSGASPRLPWPATGEAALSVSGLGLVGRVRDRQPVAVGVLSGVLSAYVILKDHPLSGVGDEGPAIRVTPLTLASYRLGAAEGEPEVPVRVGESLSELDALEGLLVDSGGDMGTLLAHWDAGSISAFVKKMNHYARLLDLVDTRIAEPSGVNDAMQSTPSDLIRVALAAMRISVFRQIVSLSEIDLPGVGPQYNANFVLGQSGVVGIEVGSDTSTNGCYLFTAQTTVDGKTISLYGVVLGQSGPQGPNTAAVDAGRSLISAAFSHLSVVSLPAGRVVGHLLAPWGASTPVTTSGTVSVLGWPGLRVVTPAKRARISLPLKAGTRVGWLQIENGTHLVDVALRSTAPIGKPSMLWRLTR